MNDTTRTIPLLDKGYIRFIESWGSDESIIEAARMSTQKGFVGWGPLCPNEVGLPDIERAKHDLKEHPDPDVDAYVCDVCGTVARTPGDEKLLSYLWRNNHSTPFEFAGMVVEVKAPLIVFREWHRHRAAGYNEASARYAPLPDDNYMPTIERLMMKGGHLTKQAASADSTDLQEIDGLEWLADLAAVYEHCERVYQRGLRIGVPKELARLSMTVGRYSKMRATTNLRMWLHFCGLRMAPVAQWEIREYAIGVGSFLSAQFPRTWDLFNAASKQ